MVHVRDINKKCHFLLFLTYLENMKKMLRKIFYRKLNFLSIGYIKKNFFRYHKFGVIV